jgi:Kyakuja-Dileera-Zisupton transposase
LPATIPDAGPSTAPKNPSDVFPPNLNSDAGDDDIAWLNIAEDDETQKIINICVERWRSAGPEARKKMFALFAVAGIFVAVCRHGHLLVICDMIRSGEL